MEAEAAEAKDEKAKSDTKKAEKGKAADADGGKAKAAKKADAGEEKAVHGGAMADFGNPLRIRRALDQGVQVIMAHCGALGTGVDLDKGENGPAIANFELFLRLMSRPGASLPAAIRVMVALFDGGRIRDQISAFSPAVKSRRTVSAGRGPRGQTGEGGRGPRQRMAVV